MATSPTPPPGTSPTGGTTSPHHPDGTGSPSPPPRRAEQATVCDILDDGSLTVLRDDGLLVDVPAVAVTSGGWIAPRSGQRVTVWRAADGTVALVLPPAVPPSPDVHPNARISWPVGGR
ncbi:hypothetical protein [Actinoalloteichus caeruleus]|uniref:hypothetical protein n=1 Tax=Actinoalloteichus cyanogriseus TaxID=2893586 RepID=UPI00042133C8|nr:hypothetical protein [Actinoalloteichus caeruleus]